MSQPLVEVRNLRRSFGAIEAVRGLDFDIEPGQTVGFIGANGAGKTTAMRIMATLDAPDSGSVRIGGYDTLNHPREVRQLIGWMPDAYGTYSDTTVLEYLDFYARAYGFGAAQRRQRVDAVMEFANLGPLADRAMNQLSKGMAQRLCLGRTLLHDPRLLILDEPAAGLDPKARIEFKQLVRRLAGEGKTFFISSHILSELGEICDSLLFIDQGRIVHHGSADHLLNPASREAVVEVRLLEAPGALIQWIAARPGVTLVETIPCGARLRLEAGGPEALSALLRALIRDGFGVCEFRREGRKLEDAFVEMLAGGSSSTEPPAPPVL
ncbi:MAG TPA: ABC transporter ATP-binding protein [Chthoniobacteraceae bacterium]|nr:ABC transporter ATP-binding protein [Chthoniobacteraceae bacterium]